MTENKENELKIYEAGYLLVPELAEGAVAEEVNSLKTLILDKFGGAEISSEMPKPIDLAYTMERRVGSKNEKYSKAHFGWIKFEVSPEAIGAIKAVLDNNNKIIRFLIIKTVRNNTLVTKKALRAGENGKKKSADENEPVAAMSEEELDKTIEGLVIE